MHLTANVNKKNSLISNARIMSNSSPPPVNAILGSGIVELAALTVLIGSRTAESLALGNRGPAGLPWAVMSMFGEVLVVRACVAAITPGWLRETLAVRNPETDAALGLNLDLSMKNLRSRAPIGAAIGIVRKIVPEVSTKSAKEDARDVYAFDRITSAYLGTIPATRLFDRLKVYIIARELHLMSKFKRNAWDQALGLAISTIKFVEVFILWKRKAVILSLVTCASWGFFFFGASALLALQLTCEFRDSRPHVDILAGKLPSPPIAAGGDLKLVIGTRPNPCENIAWTIFWFLGGLVCATSIVVTYIILCTLEDRVTFYTWMGFQTVWLASRSVFFHFARGTEAVFGHPSLSVREWEGLQPRFKERVRRLVFALSRYQMHVHPRGSGAYQNDLQILDKLGDVQEAFHLGDYKGLSVHIRTIGVLGDTLLSSASYVFGSSAKLTVESLYDSAIIGLIREDGSLVFIPCARVASDVPCEWQLDPENPRDPEFPPRGTAPSGRLTVSWHYWIPCDAEGRWLRMKHFLHEKLEGNVVAEVVTDKQISEQLGRGELFVSLKDVEEVKEIVRNSREACRIIVEMLQS